MTEFQRVEGTWLNPVAISLIWALTTIACVAMICKTYTDTSIVRAVDHMHGPDPAPLPKRKKVKLPATPGVSRAQALPGDLQ